MKTIVSLLLLAVVNLIHCQEHEQMIVFTLQGVLQKLEDISNTLKGHEELLQRIPDVQEKLKHLENNVEDVQEKLEHLENNLQGLSQDIGQCLRGDDLEHLTNVSAADIDDCIQGCAECDSNAKCTNTLGSYSCSCNPPFEGDGRTCSCPPGFASNGDICEDLDECSSAEGKVVCVPNAVCKNTIGSYSCSCNKPFEGDGRTSCEFHCRSPAKFISGVGCIMQVDEYKSHNNMNDFCQEEGGRLWTYFTWEQLQDVGNAFSGWVGVYDGKWTSDEESVVPKDLWGEGRYRPDISRRCGEVAWESSSSSYKVFQWDCSDLGWGVCQFQQ